MLCLTVLTLCAPARAGHYSLAISGGQYTDGNGGTYEDTQNGTEGGADYLTGGDPTGYVNEVSGTFTVTCTWVPSDANNPQNDPPPQDVILDETGYAYWESGDGTLDGSCSDGLGDPEVPNTDSLPYLTSGSPQLDNDHYSVHAGGASFSYQRTAMVSGNGDNYSDMIYSVGVFPVSTCPTPTQDTNYDTSDSLGGVTVDTDGSLKALTGQQISVGLNLGGANAQESNFHWSATGGSPFETWDQTAPNVNHATQLVPLSDADKVATNFNFNDAIGGDTVIVNCTATVTFPDNTTWPVTAQSQPVTFVKPTAVWVVDPPSTGIYTPGFHHDADLPGTHTYPASIGDVELWPSVTIDIPPLFDFNEAGGSCCLCQIMELFTGTLSVGDADITYAKEVLVDGGQQFVVAPYALDGQFPYAGATWPVGLPNGIGDVPAQPYDGDIAVLPDTDNDWADSECLGDEFHTWLMYGADIWVPIQEIYWGWDGSAIRNSRTLEWTFSGHSNSQASPDSSTGAGIPTDTPPSWYHTATSPAMRPS